LLIHKNFWKKTGSVAANAFKVGEAISWKWRDHASRT
jgi:hypothetical protein